MKETIRYLIKPFKNDWFFLLVFFLLISIVDVYFSVLIYKNRLAVYLICCNLLVSYILTLLVNSFESKKLRRGIRIVALIPAVLFFIIDVVCVENFHYYFNPDMAAIIGGTNMNEALEFVETFISVKLILILLCSLLVVGGLSYCHVRKIIQIGNKWATLGFLSVIVSFVLVIRNPKILERTICGKIVACFESSVVPDLEQMNPQWEIIKEKRPNNVVLIIGESFSKSHSSLYHYSKETNPYLSKLKDHSLFVYNNVISPGLHTIESIKCIMSTYKLEYGDSIPWFKCLTFPEMFKTLDYNTFWISNQSKKGLFDNLVGKYADLCEENYFVGNKFSGMNRQENDESVISLLLPLVNRKCNLNFYVVHLMGSHYLFDKRYPAQFGKFKENDYIYALPSQRYNLSTYDNSILYNDSVVYEIINLFKEKESIVFYFSDHALDIYESSKDYVGHARENDSLSVKVGREIPFLIYLSPKYQEHFSTKTDLIKSSVNKSFRTDDLIYTLMDVVGVDLKDNRCVEKYSLFSK